MTENCPRCGAPRGTGDVFCNTCGSPLPQPSVTMEVPAAPDDTASITTLVPFPPGQAPPPPPPFSRPAAHPPRHTTGMRRRRAAIPLVDTFRFVHEPINETNASRFIGRESELAAFIERVRFSDGGSFLLTGYRGV